MDHANNSAISRRWDGDFAPVFFACVMGVRTVDASLSGQGGFVSAWVCVCVCETSAQASAVSRCICTHPASDIMQNSED